jgi:hypothetical protein
MPIKVHCPSCDKEYTLADALAGKRVRCKNCSDNIDVPRPEKDEDDIPVLPPADDAKRSALRASPAPAVPRPRSKARDEDDEDEDRHPAKGGKTAADGSRTTLFVLLGVGLVLLLLCGGGVGIGIYFAVRKGPDSAETTAAEKKDDDKDKGKPGDPRDYGEALTWLRGADRDKLVRAMDWLSRQEADPTRQGDVLFALSMIANDRSQEERVRQGAAKLQEKWRQIPDFGNPQNTTEALAWLKDKNGGRRSKALDYFNNQPIDAKRRDEVIAALNAAAGNPGDFGGMLSFNLQNALKRWRESSPGTPRDFEEAYAWLRVLNDPGKQKAAADWLAQQKPDRAHAREVVAALDTALKRGDMNDFNTRRSAEIALNAWKTIGEKIEDVDDAIAWLKEGGDPFNNKVKKAAEWLERQPPQPNKRADVVTALDQAAARENDINTRQAVLNALATWADAGSVDVLIRCLDYKCPPDLTMNDKVRLKLAELKDPKAIDPLALRAAQFGGDGTKALDALGRMGPIAEDAVADVMLNTDNGSVRRNALTVLAQIGTKKSVPKVEAAVAKDASLRPLALQAVKLMMNR